MSRAVAFLFLAMGLAVQFGAAPLPTVRAAPRSPGVSVWSKPFNVSRSPGESTDPTIVADQTGLVHLFWSEEVGGTSGGTPQRQHGNAVEYSRWDGSSWSDPVDVLVSPDGGEVWQPVAAVDSLGVLHVIWTSATKGRLYYSHAPVEKALSAQGWSTPVQLTSGMPTLALPAAIAVDHQGVIHVVYSSYGYGAAVMHVASTDGGTTWSAATPVSQNMPVVGEGTLVSGGISLAVDEDDGLHVGWSMYNQEGFGVAVYYAHSFDGGLTWSTPFIVGEKAENDYEADWLNIATVGTDQVFLVWTGIGREPGRVYRISTDRGVSWSPPVPFMEDLVGETESPRMVVDSASVVHLLTPARTAGAAHQSVRTSGTRYLYWTGQSWSDPYLIPGPDKNPSYYGGFRHTATVRLGNELFDAWYDEGLGEILVVHGKSGALSLPPVPFARRVRTPTPTVTPTLPSPEQTVTPVPSATSRPGVTSSSIPPVLTQTTKPFWAVLAGVIPASFIVGVVLLLQLTRDRTA